MGRWQITSRVSMNIFITSFTNWMEAIQKEFLTQTLSWNQGVKNLKVDFDSDGEIDFKEFCFAVIESIMDPEYNSKLKMLYEKYDSDNDGNISIEELEELIEEADEEAWKSVDVNRDGAIRYREFLMVIFDVEAEFEQRNTRKNSL